MSGRVAPEKIAIIRHDDGQLALNLDFEGMSEREQELAQHRRDLLGHVDAVEKDFLSTLAAWHDSQNELAELRNGIALLQQRLAAKG